MLSLHQSLLRPLPPHLHPPSLSLFDTHANLVWVADAAGHVSSYTSSLEPYTAFAAPAPTAALSTTRNAVVALSPHMLTARSRSAMPRARAESAERLVVMSPGLAEDSVVAAGEGIHVYDVNRMLRTASSKSDQVHLLKTCGKHIVTGTGLAIHVSVTENGKIKELAQFSLSGPSLLSAHGTTVLAACTLRRLGASSPDPLISVFDLRQMRPIAPVLFPAGAAFVALHPRIHNLCYALSSGGILQIMDLYDPTSFRIFQMNLPQGFGTSPTSRVVSFDVSSTGDHLVMTDSANNVHLWLTDFSAPFNSHAQPLVYPEAAVIPVPTFSPDDYSQLLNTVGMPYYKELLLSNYPLDLTFGAGTLSKKIPRELRVTALFQPMAYSRSRYGPRNVHQLWYSLERKKHEGPAFISQQDESRKSDDALLRTNPERTTEIPPAFSKLHILYLKFGIEDFDFAFYNRSNGLLSGLEVDVPNSYTNSVLALYRCVPAVYNAVTRALLSPPLENRVLCELGYLYDMMAHSGGRACRAGNLQSVLRERDWGTPGDSLAILAEGFNRYLLDKIGGVLFSMAKETETRLTMCTHLIRSVDHITTLELETPPETPFRRKERTLPSILPYIQAAMTQQTQDLVGMWCGECGRVQPMAVWRTVRALPGILALSMRLDDDREMIRSVLQQYAAQGGEQSWLVREFYAKMSNSLQRPIVKATEAEFGTQDKKSKRKNEVVKYTLAGFVCEVSGSGESSTSEDHHLVTFVQIDGSWYLVNDFLVVPISQKEALNFLYWWKKPLLAIYQSTKVDCRFQYELDTSQLDTSVLYRDHFARGTREGKQVEYELLTQEEAPQPGTLVALDAEFVVLAREQHEMALDGTRVLVTPKRLALARVSVVRGSGEKKGVAFIDDYIVIEERIEDYLTSFLGIEPGDLDPETLKKTLTLSDVAYRKLWLLLQLGVVFVGHGLSNDFRAINIMVPEHQVRDTLVLYLKKNVKRKLGLKFLMYIVLGKKVQEGNHDSIEDAKSALDLYDRYESLKAEGKIDEELDRIYSEGSRLGFRVPI